VIRVQAETFTLLPETEEDTRVHLSEKQVRMCQTHSRDFPHLRALLLNRTLKRSPDRSHTEGLIALSRTILEKNGVPTEARMLRSQGDIPAHGNQRAESDAGCRFDFEIPEHR